MRWHSHVWISDRAGMALLSGLRSFRTTVNSQSPSCLAARSVMASGAPWNPDARRGYLPLADGLGATLSPSGTFLHVSAG